MCEGWAHFSGSSLIYKYFPGIKKKTQQNKTKIPPNKQKSIPMEMFVRLCEDEGMEVTLIFQNKRFGVIYIK